MTTSSHAASHLWSAAERATQHGRRDHRVDERRDPVGIGIEHRGRRPQHVVDRRDARVEAIADDPLALARLVDCRAGTASWRARAVSSRRSALTTSTCTAARASSASARARAIDAAAAFIPANSAPPVENVQRNSPPTIHAEARSVKLRAAEVERGLCRDLWDQRRTRLPLCGLGDLARQRPRV